MSESSPQTGDKPVHRYPHARNCYRSAWGTWFVQLQWHGERWYLGSYETEQEAIDVRDAFYASIQGDGDLGR
jgi:hypothetical protein